MTGAAAIFLLLFVAVSLETLAGGVGLVVPLTASTVFCLGGLLGWRAALPLAVLAGAWLDLLYGRPWLASSAAMAVACLMSREWPLGERAQPAGAYLLPGALVGGVGALAPLLPAWLAANAGISAMQAGWVVGQVLATAIIGALLLPLLILALDALAAPFQLPRLLPGPASPRRELGGEVSRGPTARGGR